MSSVVVDPFCQFPSGTSREDLKPMVSRAIFCKYGLSLGSCYGTKHVRKPKKQSLKKTSKISEHLFGCGKKQATCQWAAGNGHPLHLLLRTAAEPPSKNLWNTFHVQDGNCEIYLGGKSTGGMFEWKANPEKDSSSPKDRQPPQTASKIPMVEGSWRFRTVCHRPPQQMWQTPYPESCDSPLRGARLKWRSRWPTEIKNGQSPLTPIGTSLRQMSRPKTLSGMPSFIASLKLSASSAAASSNASGLSEYVSFKAANASHRVVSSTASNKLANWQFQKDKGSSKHHIASAGWGSAAPILISKIRWQMKMHYRKHPWLSTPRTPGGQLQIPWYESLSLAISNFMAQTHKPRFRFNFCWSFCVCLGCFKLLLVPRPRQICHCSSIIGDFFLPKRGIAIRTLQTTVR